MTLSDKTTIGLLTIVAIVAFGFILTNILHYKHSRRALYFGIVAWIIHFAPFPLNLGLFIGFAKGQIAKLEKQQEAAKQAAKQTGIKRPKRRKVVIIPADQLAAEQFSK